MYARRIAYHELSMKQWLVTTISIGVAIGLFLVAIGGYLLFERSNHAKTWQPVTATISGTGELCHMSRKSGKNWNFVEAIECQNVDGYIAANPDRQWRSSKVDYVTFDYDANGQAKKQLVPLRRVSLEPVSAGQQLALYVNPQNADEFDRPIGEQDYADFRLMAYIALGIAAGMLLFGAFLGWLSERKRRRMAAEQAAV